MRRIVFIIVYTVLAVCALSMFVQAGESSSADIEEIYAPVEFSFDGEKVSFEFLERDCVLIVASYESGQLKDTAFRPLKMSDDYLEIKLSELELDITNADTIKTFVFSDTDKFMPLCRSKSINLSAADAKDAYLFVYLDGSMDNGLAKSSSKRAPRDNIVSGWLFDNRAGTARRSIEDSINGVIDLSDTQGSALIREFNEISDGVVTAEFSAVVDGIGNIIEFRDCLGKTAYKIRNNGNNWEILCADGNYTYLAERYSVGSEKFRIILDFVSGKSTTYINNVYLGQHELISDNIVNFRFAIDEEGIGSIIPKKITMTANYGIYENFDTFGVEEVYGWSVEGSVNVSSGELVLSDRSTVSKMFSPIGAKYAADMLAIFPENENVSISIRSNNAVSVMLENRDGILYANGNAVYELTQNMWYRLRIEADPVEKTADIILNGRNIGKSELYTSCPVNYFEITNTNGNARIDDIRLFAVIDHEDYVPKPCAKADLSDWIVVVNVCSLWRDDSQHYGWACITPYDENKPVLGYYDEGSPESADWEIKYMVEHGIDVQAFCWYADESNGPLKRQRNSYQLHEGYQLAKYKDYMKYCVIWETHSGAKFKSAQFRNYVIPYWFENYFLDENYLVIDNKPVLHVYAVKNLFSDDMFGSVENAAAELAYLEEVAKNYGFDGILYVSNGTISELESLGIDAYAAYHWGENGYRYETNVEKNTELAEQSSKTNGSVYTIPTISVGYNDFAWRSFKAPLMTVEDYERCHDWVTDEYIPQYAEKGTWQEKMVWLSTWNEYGEGTYLMPAEDLCGFGYLDVLRNKYTGLDEVHVDTVPTEKQGKRIQYLYPQYTRHLRRQGDYESDCLLYQISKNIALSSDKITANGISGLGFVDGKIIGTSNGTDPNLHFKDAVNTDVCDVDVIRIRLKTKKGTVIKLYYATEDSPLIDETKTIVLTADTDDVNDYMFYLRNIKAFEGTLKSLRLDPATEDNIYFEIHSVEFLDAKDELIINNCKIQSVIDPEEVNGELLFPYDPETGVNYIMHSFINWNHDEKILTIEANSHKVVYTVGKDTFTIDGVEKDLGYTLYQTDGLPMISYKTLAEALGYTFKKDGNNHIVKTPESYLYVETEESNVSWEFDRFMSHGWSSGNSDLIVNDGYIRLDNTERENRDPSMTLSLNAGFPAEKYPKIEVRLRYKYDGEEPHEMCMFFITSTDKNWHELKKQKVVLNSTSSDGEWETYTFDMSANSKWQENIIGLRFDPFNASGYAEIDYIRLIEKSE